MEALPLGLQWHIGQYLNLCIPITKDCINADNICSHIKWAIDNERLGFYRFLVQIGVEMPKVRYFILQHACHFVKIGKSQYLKVLLEFGFTKYRAEFINANTFLPLYTRVYDTECQSVLKEYGINKSWGNSGVERYNMGV